MHIGWRPSACCRSLVAGAERAGPEEVRGGSAFRYPRQPIMVSLPASCPQGNWPLFEYTTCELMIAICTANCTQYLPVGLLNTPLPPLRSN